MTEKWLQKRWNIGIASQVLAEADASGLSDHAFARRKGIDPQRLWWWRNRMRRTTDATPDFVELAVAPVAPRRDETRVEIILRNGRSVVIPTTVDPTQLTALLDAIEGSTC